MTPPGLCNVGNTCYANAVLQGLAAVPIFGEAILADVAAGGGCAVSQEVRKLILDMLTTDGSGHRPRVLDPTSVMRALAPELRAQGGITNPMLPQDAHELMCVLLLVLSKAAPHPSRLHQIITGGQMRSAMGCTACKKTWASPPRWEHAEDYVCIMLTPPPRRGGAASLLPSTPISSSQMLRSYMDPETVGGWTCEACHATTDVVRRVQLRRMPKMLALCVPHVGAFDRSRPIHPSERFIVMQPGDAAEGDAAAASPPPPPSPPRRVMYTLCSVVSHTGSSTNGHYTAYSRTHDPPHPPHPLSGGTCSSWYLCDDECVRSVPSDAVLFPSDAAFRRPYIMFYMGAP